MESRHPRITGTPVPLSRLADSVSVRALLPAGDVSRVDARVGGFNRCAAELARLDVSGETEAIGAFVPGRVEVLGKHTDYCGGRSLLCAVDRGFHFVAARRNDARVRITSIDQAECFEVDISADLALRPGHWSNYLLTTIRRLARNFDQPWTGCDIAFTSDLPAAAGLSSSSALIIGTFLVLATINQLQQHPAYQRNLSTPADLANYLGCVENGSGYRELAGDHGVGTFGGSQDHTAILFAEPDALVQYQFSPVRHEASLSLPHAFRLVIVNSGVRAEKTGDAKQKYNDVSLRVRRMVSLWNDSQPDPADNLRELLEQPDAERRLNVLIDAQPPAERQSLAERLAQYRQEAEVIIPEAAEAIRHDNWARFGDLVDQSQHHAETKLYNQVPQTIALQRALRSAGALAASAFGAGFGGSVWALAADAASADQLVQAAAAAGFSDAFITRAACAAFVL